MGGVRVTATNLLLSPGVPLPDEFRVAGKGAGSCQILRPVLAPEAVLSTKRGNTRFGADPCSREDHDALGLGENRAGAQEV
jgi:hypothetical protein